LIFNVRNVHRCSPEEKRRYKKVRDIQLLPGGKVIRVWVSTGSIRGVPYLEHPLGHTRRDLLQAIKDRRDSYSAGDGILWRFHY